MADEEKLRSELRHHIEAEMKRANSEDDLTQDEIEKTSLFEHELRAFLKMPQSISESSIEAAIAKALGEKVVTNVWEDIPEEKESAKAKTDYLNEK
jgi:hypothetical protein